MPPTATRFANAAQAAFPCSRIQDLADTNTFLIRDDSGLRRKTYGPHRPHESRLERDGWIVKESGTSGPVFEKTIEDGWILRNIGEVGTNLNNLENASLRSLCGNGRSGTVGGSFGLMEAVFGQLKSRLINSTPCKAQTQHPCSRR